MTEDIREMYPDAVDVTDEVKNYAKGKVFECECEQGFGVPYGEQMWKCPSCHELIIDAKAGQREPPSEEDNSDNEIDDSKDQSNLEAFF